MGTITSELGAILAHLVRLHRPVVRFLKPGLSESRIPEILGDLEIAVPLELREMYSCRDGILIPKGHILDDLHFFPGFYWLSLEDAVTTYKSLHGDRRWHSSWFPVFANGGGDFYAVVCTPTPVDSGEVVGFILGESDHPVEFRDLTAMLRTVRACFDEKVFFLSAEGYLEADDMAQARVARRFNPDLPFYRELA